MIDPDCTVIILRQIEPFHIDEDEQELFKLNFVQVQKDRSRALEMVSQNTILLVDLDAIEKPCMQFLKEITRDLSKHIPLVVCSKNESRQFMLDCIQAGAVDYLLKPLTSNVIKTLFLKVHKPTQKPSTLYDRVSEINSKDSQIDKILVDAFSPKRTLINRPNITKERSLELEVIMSSWDFSPFELTLEELVHLVYLILNKVLILPELHFISITKAQLYDFIIDLAGVYHDENPYHNFAHAVDVMQCLYYILKELNVFSRNKKTKTPQDVLRPKDILALLIAAIGHDAAHPGVNNLFLINSSNPLAKLYNDQSVLESLHSMTLFQLLNKHGVTQFFDTPDEYKEFRKIIVSSILATDMAHHADYVCKIKEQANCSMQQHQEEEESSKQRLLLCCALIKCADISNVARPFRRGIQWAHLLVEEFMCQGDLEKKLGLPVLPMNDRNQVVLEDTQVGFIRFVALDLFQSVREILKELSFAVEQMQANLKQWEMRKNNNNNNSRSSSTSSWTVHDSGVEQDSIDDLSNRSMLLKTDNEPYPFEYEEFSQKRDCSCCLIQ